MTYESVLDAIDRANQDVTYRRTQAMVASKTRYLPQVGDLALRRPWGGTSWPIRVIDYQARCEVFTRELVDPKQPYGVALMIYDDRRFCPEVVVGHIVMGSDLRWTLMGDDFVTTRLQDARTYFKNVTRFDVE